MRTSDFLFLLFLCFTKLPGDEWQRVYLASFPRSGNHWVRSLIEESTHIATGSVYRDKKPVHSNNPFPWGGYCAKNSNWRYPELDDIVVIKTHYPQFSTKFDLQPCLKVIRIVRHPLDCFVSEYEKRHRQPFYIPEKVLKKYIANWKKFQNYWNNQENVLTIRYEDLLKDPEHILREILEAIGYKVADEDIKRALSTHPPVGAPLKKAHIFSQSDWDLIQSELHDLLEIFNYLEFQPRTS